MASLEAPSTAVHGSFLSALEEYRELTEYTDNRHHFMRRAASEHDLTTDSGFARYVAGQTALSNVTVLWWIEAGEFVGRLTIRHELVGWLETHGGHIGYEVRPSRRGAGHAKAMLLASLPTAGEFGIERALVTCDYDNHASKAVIEAAGATFESRLDHKLRYWIETT